MLFGYAIGIVLIVAGCCFILTTHYHFGWMAGVDAAVAKMREELNQTNESNPQ